MKSIANTALDSVLTLMRPLARLLIRSGVSYPTFALALKTVFLEAAQAELLARAMPQTDSAVSLLSGVHRRDVRTLTRPTTKAPPQHENLGLVAQVVARWLNEADYAAGPGQAKVLPRGSGPGSFDHLVAMVSSDVRPRAVLDELQRLGVASEDEQGIHLLTEGFVPKQGQAEMARLIAANLHDHAAAASLNLQGEASFLEQAVFVDELTPASAERLHAVSRQAWKQAFQTVMREAQTRFDDDAVHAEAADKTQRARFGVYFYSEEDKKS